MVEPGGAVAVPDHAGRGGAARDRALIEFSNNASKPALNQPLGNNGGDAGGFNFVPNMYVAIPINKQFAFGLGVNAPFGLTTEYDDGWIGRYQALKSEIKTINVNPAMSWQATRRSRSARASTTSTSRRR